MSDAISCDMIDTNASGLTPFTDVMCSQTDLTVLHQHDSQVFCSHATAAQDVLSKAEVVMACSRMQPTSTIRWHSVQSWSPVQTHQTYLTLHLICDWVCVVKSS